MRYATGYLRYSGGTSGDVYFDNPITPTTVKLGKCKMLGGVAGFQNAQLFLERISDTSFSMYAKDSMGSTYRFNNLAITITSTGASFRGFGTVYELEIIDVNDNIDNAGEIPDWCGILLARIFSSDLSFRQIDDVTIVYYGGIAATLQITNEYDDTTFEVNSTTIKVPYNGTWNSSIYLNVFPDYAIVGGSYIIINSNYKFSVEEVVDENGIATKLKFIFNTIYMNKVITINRYRFSSIIENQTIRFNLEVGTNEYIVDNYYSGVPSITFKDSVLPDIAPYSNSISISSVSMNLKIELNKNDGKIYTHIIYQGRDVTSLYKPNFFYLCDVSTPACTHIALNNTGIFSITTNGIYGIEATYDGDLITFNKSNYIGIDASLDASSIYLKKENLRELIIEDVEYADEYEIELNGEVIETLRSLKKLE